MTTLSTLVNEWLTRELRTDDSTELFTDARRLDGVHAGEQEFADITECLVRQSSITCSNGVREYDLLATSTDYIRIAAQGPEYRIVSSVSTAVGSTRRTAGGDFPRKDVERLNREDPGWRDSTGSVIPTSWYLRMDGGKTYFGFAQPPSIGSSETATLLVPYVANPAASTALTAEPFTVGSDVRTDLRPYHRALVHWAASDLEKLRGDDEASDRQLQKFNGYVLRYLESKKTKGSRRISLQKNYFMKANKSARRGSS